MINSEKLSKFCEIDIEDVSKENLVDESSIKINEKDFTNKFEEFIDKIKNPYCFKCEDIAIKVEFSDIDLTIEEALTNYFVALKQSEA